MLILCIADAEKDVSMKNLSPKEAITILEGMRIDIPVPKAAVTQIKRNLALDMAINALNCSEIPNNSDVISRQAAKDIFTELYGISAIGSVFDKYEWADICETTANELPSIQPERKTGHWILDRSGAYCCSKCMEPCATYAMMKPRDKFCKMCGAKMESGEQDG